MPKQTKKRIFCRKCKQPLNRENKNCSESHHLDGELGSGQYETRTSDNSGFSSQLLPVRTSILSELQSSRTTSFKKNKKTRKQVLRRLLHFGLLEQELRQITEYINFDVLAHNDHSIIDVLVLQAYFDILQIGETPSLQEQMRYQWLRLESFSSYSGDGSPVHLARNGFYHLSGNETCCFCCKVSYSKWTYSDNVQEIHRQISPNCSFVNIGGKSSGNISIETDSVQNEPNLVVSGNTGHGSTQAPNSSQTTALSVNHREFLFGTGVGSSTGGEATSTTRTEAFGLNFRPASTRPNQSCGAAPSNQSVGTATTTTEASVFHFGESSNTRGPAGLGYFQCASQLNGGSDVTTKLTGLTPAHTNQQSIGVQQPFVEPNSRNPAVAPTQPQEVLRQDGDDDHMVEHARRYLRCSVQVDHRRQRENIPEGQSQQETTLNPTTFIPPDPMSTSVAANLLEIGLTQDRAKEAILTVRRLRGHLEVFVVEVIDWMLEGGNAPQDEPSRTDVEAVGIDILGNGPAEPPRSWSPATSSSRSSESAAVGEKDSDSHTSTCETQVVKTDTQGAAGGAEVKCNLAESKSSGEDLSYKDKGKSYNEGNKLIEDKKVQSRKDNSKTDRHSRARKEHSPGPSEGAALLLHGDADIKALKEENKVLKQMRICKICMNKNVSAMFLPCGHLVCCEDCARIRNECPKCRQRIKGQIRTLMS